MKILNPIYVFLKKIIYTIFPIDIFSKEELSYISSMVMEIIKGETSTTNAASDIVARRVEKTMNKLGVSQSRAELISKVAGLAAGIYLSKQCFCIDDAIKLALKKIF